MDEVLVLLDLDVGRFDGESARERPAVRRLFYDFRHDFEEARLPRLVGPQRLQSRSPFPLIEHALAGPIQHGLQRLGPVLGAFDAAPPRFPTMGVSAWVLVEDPVSRLHHPTY